MAGKVGLILGLAAIAAGLALSSKSEAAGFPLTAGKRHRIIAMVATPAGFDERQFAEGVAQGLRASGMTEVNVTPGTVATLSYIVPVAPVSGRIAAEIPFALGGVSAPFRVTSVEPV